MTPLEAARKMADQEPVCPHPNSAIWLCTACSQETDDEHPDDDCFKPSSFNHYPDCPWLAMPKIIAALEAAEKQYEQGYANGENSNLASAFAVLDEFGEAALVEWVKKAWDS